MFPSRSTEFLERSLQAAKSELEGFCTGHDRPLDSVRLLPVTKAVDADTTANLYRLGERQFAENRADALVAKARDLADRDMHPVWHFIGPLQRNKARRVVMNAQVLHSVHSMALVETLDRIASEEGRNLDLYLQVHLSGEDRKQGFAAEDVLEAARVVSGSGCLQLVGLMAMGPLDDADGTATERVFRTCVELGRGLESQADVVFKHSACHFSMGMSRDMGAAVAAGTHLVRVGSALYR
ncbi:MAG: YggS family pyridoxal phosphate-dependent enzyme [Planctomycetota bacterium]|nr:YggS family pyridoxal phosphate-dependent enzyme [Planctomycetota bacterium]